MSDFSTLQGLTIPVMTKRVNLTNLVPAINGTEGFTVSGGTGTRSIEASTTHTKYAAQSLKMSLGSDCSEVCANSTGTYPLDASHLYYFRIEGYQEVKCGTMEMYFPIAEPHPFNIPAKGAGQWNIYSIVCDRSTFSSGDHRFRIDFNNENPYVNAEVWYDGVMIVDLTAACGTGNEPSKEWCDANIPYFTGSCSLDIPLSSPAQASVTQITDAAGNVLWSAVKPEPVVLEVEKQAITSYAGETSYSDNCVLLDIYPKKANSTVNVTYGGLTKTLTFSGTNAQQVYFGTFNGVADSVETPASGTLTIEGDYSCFSSSEYTTDSKGSTKYAGCVTNVIDWGSVRVITANMFENCTNLSLTSLPEWVTVIGYASFKGCTNLALTSLPNGVIRIDAYAFSDCTNLALSELPSGIKSISANAFRNCSALALTELPSGVTNIGASAFYGCTSLALTSLPSGVTTIGGSAFQGCTSLALTSLPSGITSIGNSVFYDCKNIDISVIPEGVVSIAASAFYMSDYSAEIKMKGNNITLPASIQSISLSSFAAYFDDGITSGDAFYHQSITILATTPPECNAGTIVSTGNPFQLIVPKGCRDAYLSAGGWNNISSNNVVEAA